MKRKREEKGESAIKENSPMVCSWRRALESLWATRFVSRVLDVVNVVDQKKKKKKRKEKKRKRDAKTHETAQREEDKRAYQREELQRPTNRPSRRIPHRPELQVRDNGCSLQTSLS